MNDRLWLKRGGYSTYEEFVPAQSGCTTDELVKTGDTKYKCPDIDKAAAMIKDAVKRNVPIHVIVDYDADGLDSGAEIFMILQKLGAKDIKITVPKRMSDGYGMNMRMVNEIPDGAFVITIDNGITAVEPIREAKRRGMTVLILDHHQQNGDIPEADLIIDPEAFPIGWTFNGYCGAGLTFKLAQYLFPDDTVFLDQLSCFAAIATVGDSVNVTGDNRNIIRRGLDNINKRNCVPGLSAILDVLGERDKVEHVGIYEIAFKIAPMFNAPGRLDDDGGRFVLNALFQRGNAKQYAEQLHDTNTKRKEMVNTAIETLQPKGTNIAFLYDASLPEGLCGIIAGHLASDLHRPAFVMTDSAAGVKGSARCEADQDVFKLMQTCSDIFTQFGGHQCAAGFSLEKKDVDRLLEELDKHAPVPTHSDIQYYDLDIDENDLLNAYIHMNRIGVYGVGLEKPVLRVKTTLSDVRAIGGEQQHLKCRAANMPAIGFSLAEKYQALGEPQLVTLYGTLSTNYWKGRGSAQYEIMDIEA